MFFLRLSNELFLMFIGCFDSWICRYTCTCLLPNIQIHWEVNNGLKIRKSKISENRFLISHFFVMWALSLIYFLSILSVIHYLFCQLYYLTCVICSPDLLSYLSIILSVYSVVLIYCRICVFCSSNLLFYLCNL